MSRQRNVLSDHRVSVTYSRTMGGGPAEGSVSETASSLVQVMANEHIFRTTFEALFENPQFLPDSDTLGLGLQHI